MKYFTGNAVQVYPQQTLTYMEKKSEFIRFLEYVKRYTAAFVLVMLTMLLEGYNFLWRECCCE